MALFSLQSDSSFNILVHLSRVMLCFCSLYDYWFYTDPLIECFEYNMWKINLFICWYACVLYFVFVWILIIYFMRKLKTSQFYRHLYFNHCWVLYCRMMNWFDNMYLFLSGSFFLKVKCSELVTWYFIPYVKSQ